MNKFILFLPILLLFYSFLLKLFIDREPTIPLFINSIYELPTDIIYLATSFIIAYTLITPINSEREKGLIFFIFYLIISIIVVIIWRRSNRFFERNKLLLSGVFTFINYVICIYAMVKAINLVTGIIP